MVCKSIFLTCIHRCHIYIYIYIYVYQGLNYVFLSYIFRSQLVREAKTFMESGGRLSDSADRLEIMFKSCDVLKNMPGKLHFVATHTLTQVYYLFIDISIRTYVYLCFSRRKKNIYMPTVQAMMSVYPLARSLESPFSTLYDLVCAKT